MDIGPIYVCSANVRMCILRFGMVHVYDLHFVRYNESYISWILSK